MPQLGESVTEGTIEKWLVQPGDKVNKYDPLAEVNTDKVTAEIPSSFTGTIKEIIASEGETLEVGAIVCTIETEGGASTESTPAAPAKEEKQEAAPAKTEAPAKKAKGENAGRYSPAVMRLAQENDIDLTLVEGTGKGGRITRKDIQAIIDSGEIPTAAPAEETAPAQEAAPQQSAPAAPSKPAASQPKTEVPVGAGDIEIPVTGVRRAIANNMLKSKHEAPHAWMTIEVDVTNLVSYR